MPNLFVFTAGNPEAQAHLERSIRNPVAPEKVLGSFPADEHARLRDIETKGSGFYAWGATPGPQNEARWNRMEAGDSVLCVYGSAYRYFGQVLAKFRNASCATAIWGVDTEGNTWEYMYFLTKPVSLNRAVGELGEELNQGYQGFTRIGDEKVERLVRTHGSLETFIQQRLLTPAAAPAAYLLLRSNIDSKWRDEEAESYHYGTTVPNYTKIAGGAEFLLDRKASDGVRIIGRGRIGEVREEPGAATGEGRHFRAAFAEYQGLKPPRIVTPDLQERLRGEPGYNVQHSIRVLSRGLFEDLASPARAWIFQANPKMYDVRAAVKVLSEDTWTVTAYKNEIGPGDRVYLWEAGPTGGIVAAADVLDKPSVRPFPEASRPFLRDNALEVDRVRVRLSIRQVVDITRTRLHEHPRLQGLSIFEFAQASNFEVTPGEAEAIEDLIAGLAEPRIFKIAPGENAQFWDDCLNGGYVCVGWDKVGDLRSYADQDEFRQAFQREYSARYNNWKPQISRKGSEVWTLRQLNPGDRVVANRGTAEVLAVGTVVSPAYQWRAERPQYRHTVRVDWDTSVAKRIPEQRSWATTTVAPVSKELFEIIMGQTAPTAPSDPFAVLLASLRKAGLHFSVEIVSNYLLALQTKRFVILTGISGTGKTRLAMAVAGHLSGPDHRVVAAVRPDWTDNRGLLGYLSPITDRYVDTPVLRLLLRAEAEIRAAEQEGRLPQPYFVILDEMNLARVEHYFSDFLSSLESEEPLELHSADQERLGIPRRLKVPSNVFFTGTVNIDETTYMFSPKVLDRAFTIELSTVDLVSHGRTDVENAVSSPLYLTALPSDEFSFGARPGTEDWTAFGEVDGGRLRDVVVDLNKSLAQYNRPYGYRVANEIARFVVLASEQASGDNNASEAALDLAILEKILPKFHGTQRELQHPLRSLLTFAVDGEVTPGTQLERALEDEWEPTSGGGHIQRKAAGNHRLTPRFPRMATKVWRMLVRLRDQGFTSFIE